MKLNNNIEIPEIGLGTFMIAPVDAEIAVCEAIKTGYRLIVYSNSWDKKSNTYQRKFRYIRFQIIR